MEVLLQCLVQEDETFPVMEEKVEKLLAKCRIIEVRSTLWSLHS